MRSVFTSLAAAASALALSSCGGAGDAPGRAPWELHACAAETDEGPDGVLEWRTTYSYDERGYPARNDFDRGADGSFEFFHTYAYDDDGHLVRYEEWAVPEALERVIQYAYDESGRLISERDDATGSGFIVLMTTHTYDSRGRLMTSSYDGDGDGWSDAVWRWSHDDAGRVIAGTYDDGVDGFVDIQREMERDDDGRVVRSVDHSMSQWIADLEATWTRDGDHLLRMTWDRGADGVLEVELVYTWNGDDVVTARRIEPDEITETRYRYDCPR